MKQKIAVISSGRADWGLLSVPAQQLAKTFDVTIIATGQHIAALDALKADTTLPIIPIDMQLRCDGGAEITIALANLQVGLAGALPSLAPDLILLLGDRYETLGAAMAATILHVPIAHIAGGDITEGAMDDAMRHAISKLSHLHFATNETARHRLLAMGEQPNRVIVSGSPGLDRLLQEPVVSRDEFFARLGLAPRRHNAVITFHPVTLANDSEAQLEALLQALNAFGDGLGMIVTGVNADPGFAFFADTIENFCRANEHAVFHASLGPNLYANALRHCDVVLGNSSSGLYEAPTFNIPTVNIGDRQQGRLRGNSIIDCVAEKEAIIDAINEALAGDWTQATNPYGAAGASQIICDTLTQIDDFSALLRKTFYEANHG